MGRRGDSLSLPLPGGYSLDIGSESVDDGRYDVQ